MYLLWFAMPQDEDEHAATLAIIAAAQKSNPRRLLEVIADASNLLQAKGYTITELEAAIAEVLDEAERTFRLRH